MFLIVLLLSDNWHKDHIQWVRIVGNQEISTFVTPTDTASTESLWLSLSLFMDSEYRWHSKTSENRLVFWRHSDLMEQRPPNNSQIKRFLLHPDSVLTKKPDIQQVIPVPWFVYFRKSASSEEIERIIKTERRSSPPCTLNMWAHPQCPPRQQKATL